jgi:hypothetical protein
LLQFPITKNEVDCAQVDSQFELAVVTMARTRQKNIHFFNQKRFLKGFKLKPLTYMAQVKEGLNV